MVAVGGVHRLAELTRGEDHFKVLGEGQETQRSRAPRLVEPQHISLTALGQVQIGENEAVQCRGHRLEPISGLGRFGQPGHQQTQARMRPAPDPATKLVQLADAEAVSIHHHHHGGIRHVDTHFDHSGADQHVDLPGPERGHHRVPLLAGQSPVHEAEAQSG